MASATSSKATPIATPLSQPLSHAFFARPAAVVAPDLIGCLLVKRQADGELLWGVIVETEAYSQDDPACHGYRRRTPSNDTLFGEPGRFYVYVSYGIHHCVKVGRIEGAGASRRRARVRAERIQIEAVGVQAQGCRGLAVGASWGGRGKAVPGRSAKTLCQPTSTPCGPMTGGSSIWSNSVAAGVLAFL